MTERTFAMVKPDGVQRGLTGEIVRRYEARGLKVVGLKLMAVPRSKAEDHYAEHKGKPFYNGLVDYITSGPVVALCLEGKNAVAVVRARIDPRRPCARHRAQRRPRLRQRRVREARAVHLLLEGRDRGLDAGGREVGH
jgi:nucleoside diphosphate kinase